MEKRPLQRQELYSLKNHQNPPEFVDTNSDDEQELQKTSGGEQEPQKASKRPKLVDKGPGDKDPAAKIPRYCTHILTKGIRKGKQCGFRTSDETGKCHHHKKI